MFARSMVKLSNHRDIIKKFIFAILHLLLVVVVVVVVVFSFDRRNSKTVRGIRLKVINRRLPQAMHYNGEIFMCITG